MKWNELYEKNKSRKLREIKQVKNDIILKARLKNFANRNAKISCIIVLMILVVLILAFSTNRNALLLTFFMFIIIVFFIIYFNTFTISCKNNKMIVKSNNKKIEIDYSNLKNIYIEKKQSRIFIKKRDSFFIMILYKTSNNNINNINNIELTTLFLNKKEVQKFLDSFELKESKNNNIVKAQKYQLKILLIKVSLFIFVWSVIIITMLLKYNK
ncbi:MAG: hypothetical protein HFJ42_09230 [Clostridia bacterium]|nr:hypothetical protein [Clostridia bacterium]